MAGHDLEIVVNINNILRRQQQLQWNKKIPVISVGDKVIDTGNTTALFHSKWKKMQNFSEN